MLVSSRRLVRLGALAALSTGAALAVAPQAVADTNTGTAKSTMLCNIVLFSPGADVDGCSNVQATARTWPRRKL
ncbi:hypothetical protein ABZ626_23635 [Streptomyces longispororuber]|uniref:hypothetical protein n=1 Tax=Streptomyces longispororuber TaxID=68230 RepID=UPI00340D2947